MDEERKIRAFKDRFRIFLILYTFSENYQDNLNPSYKRLFKSEIRIQKIDFLIRNPDYLAFELLNIVKKHPEKSAEIKPIVKGIFRTKEPVLRRLEMERYFFGAYEDIDDVISFLKSIDFIDFSSKKSSDLRTIEKNYFIKEKAVQKMQRGIAGLGAIQWYIDRCNLIRTYFGDLSGTQLKVAQYQIEEYRNTTYKNYIGGIEQSVIEEFDNIYKEPL